MLIRDKYTPGYKIYRNNYCEIRWDLVGCNLQCQFCWNPLSNNKALVKSQTCQKDLNFIYEKTLSNCSLNQQKTFIRFTGGEPTLQWSELINVFNLFKRNNILANIPILIQTNGIEIGRNNIKLDDLYNIKQRFIFEMSFKGTNEREFSLLTQREARYYQYQIEGYRILSHIANINKNIRVIPVLGIYHSSVKGALSKYVFLDPNTKKILFDDINSWDNRFKEIWLNASTKWVEPLRMSPKGLWDNVYKTLNKVHIIEYKPLGAATNIYNSFPVKPKSYKYADIIVNDLIQS